MSPATLKNNNVSQTLAQIADAVEAVKNDGLQIFSEAASVGDSLRQGDVVLQFLGSDPVEIPHHIYQQLDTPVLQLAPGSSKGSRHILSSAEGVEMWEPVPIDEACAKYVYAKHGKKLPKGVVRWNLEHVEEIGKLEEAMAMAGPIFRLSQPTVLTHPEHGDWQLPCGTYRVIFQRTLDEQARIQRVLD
jgi:hypothetical protein